MIDLVAGVRAEFEEAQRKASVRSLCPPNEIRFDNYTALSFRAKPTIERPLTDNWLRALTGSNPKLCIVCLKSRPSESYHVKTGKLTGRVVATCDFCRKRP